MLSFSRVSNLPDDLPDWIRAEDNVRIPAHFRFCSSLRC